MSVWFIEPLRGEMGYQMMAGTNCEDRDVDIVMLSGGETQVLDCNFGD